MKCSIENFNVYEWQTKLGLPSSTHLLIYAYIYHHTQHNDLYFGDLEDLELITGVKKEKVEQFIRELIFLKFIENCNTQKPDGQIIEGYRSVTR